MALVVQKFGGATLASTSKISRVASKIKDQVERGDKLVVVVSAMGDSTDLLIAMAHELTEKPALREMDSLLCTGELVSMSMLSIALNSIGCPAIALSGARAGIKTDAHFSNASIAEIKASQVISALERNEVVVVAGFQGSTAQGEPTTLGRGGSDTTALALAASLGADRCEILKEFPAIFSADPRIVENAYGLPTLTYDELLEMTYWGAKVLQYRSVEIAKHYSICLYVGAASAESLGTLISENSMIEDREILALNSHEIVLQIRAPYRSLSEAMTWLRAELDLRNLPFPQVLHSEVAQDSIELFVTGPKELMDHLRSVAKRGVRPLVHELCSVTATCRGTTRPETLERVINSLETRGIRVMNLLVSAMSVTVFIEQALRKKAVQLLHGLVQAPHQTPQLISGS